jgi:hypothetical protein
MKKPLPNGMGRMYDGEPAFLQNSLEVKQP